MLKSVLAFQWKCFSTRTGEFTVLSQSAKRHFREIEKKMTMKQQMERKLTAEFEPQALEVIDESEQHRGHGGYREGGETHFKIVMRSQKLRGMSRVARQRAVYACVKEEMDVRVHALALDVTE
jgi:BolA protein